VLHVINGYGRGKIRESSPDPSPPGERHAALHDGESPVQPLSPFLPLQKNDHKRLNRQ